MKTFLRILLEDFENRAAMLLNRVQTLDERARKELRGYILLSYAHLEDMRRHASSIIRDPALGEPALTRNQLQLFRRLVEQFSVIDWYLIPMIERFNEQDHKITALTRRFAKEAGWPLAMPVVTSFSNQFFWTKPELLIIAVPSAEGQNFLSFPNICHEMAHILIIHHEKELLQSFLQQLESYREDGGFPSTESQQTGEQQYREGNLFNRWEKDWVEEFAADMIAVYMIGAPYGWQHLRLNIRSSRPAFHTAGEENERHPASHARMQGIAVMLSKMDAFAPAQKLMNLWDQYLLAANEETDPDFALAYPEMLMDSLAESVIAGCKQIGLKRFNVDNSNPETVVGMAQTGWNLFMQDPDAYVKWERTKIKI